MKSLYEGGGSEHLPQLLAQGDRSGSCRPRSAARNRGRWRATRAMRRAMVCCKRVSGWTSDSPLAASDARCGRGGRRRRGLMTCASVAGGKRRRSQPSADVGADHAPPCGPDPASVARSTPSSAAIRRASGDALTRPEPPSGGRAPRRRGLLAPGQLRWPPQPRRPPAPRSTSRSSPGSPMTAITAPTVTLAPGLGVDRQ